MDSGQPPWFGSRMERKEDRRFLTGRGRYVDDIPCPGVLHAAFLRSPYAHARIIDLDLSGCQAAGAVAAYKAEDLGALWRPFPTPVSHPDLRGRNWVPLAKDKVKFVGEPVAVAVAESRAAAEDALDAVQARYEVLPAASHPVRALEPGAPLVHDELGDNLAIHLEAKIGDVEKALADSPHVENLLLNIQRGGGGSMECRGVLAQYDPLYDKLLLHSSTQIPHFVRQTLSVLLQRPEEFIDVVATDVGGGFGPKATVYPEEFVVPWLAIRLERSVKWTEDRLEYIQTSIQEREQRHDVTVGFDGEGRILALKVKAVVDLGAYPAWGIVVPILTLMSIPGPYKIKHFLGEMDVAYTHRVAVAPVRGAGRPQATFVIERTMDHLARKLGLDRTEVRFRNFVQPEEFPYVVGLPTREGVMTYDSGDYPELLRRVLTQADYAALKNKKNYSAKGEGRSEKLLGVGISFNIEETGAGPFEGARIRVEPDGRVVVSTGACSQGQGHETIFSQVAADALDVSPENITIVEGDTRHISYGIGTLASRSSVTVSSAIVLAAGALREKAIALAREYFEAGGDDLDMREGRVFVKAAPDRSVTLGELAVFSLGASPGIILPPGMKPGLEAEEYFAPEKAAYSAGAHVAVVEVDPETGFVKVLRYVAGHDCGKVINPLLVEGQIRGGVVHGVGDVLIEEVAFDDNGQPLASTFLDYLLPLASDVPAIETLYMETPCPDNLVGVKGAGESGTIAAVAAIVSAVEDALAPLGIEIRESPVTPARLNELIRGKREPKMKKRSSEEQC